MKWQRWFYSGMFCVVAFCMYVCPQKAEAWSEPLTLCGESNTQSTLKLLPFSSGSRYYVAWLDQRRPGYTDIYAQGFDNDAAVLVTTNGVPLVVAGAAVGSRTNYNTLSYPFLAENGTSGFFLAWTEGTDTRDMNSYMNKYDLSGAVQWGEAGVTVQDGDTGTSADIVTDGQGGVFASWYYGGWSLWYDRTRAAMFDSDGSVTTAYGSMSDASGGNGAPANDSLVTYISDGVSIITWRDSSDGAYSGWKTLRAQKLDSSGRVWGGTGVRLALPSTNTANIVNSYDAVADGNGGLAAVWQDQRYGEADIFAQLVNGSGELQWSTGGIPVCTAPEAQSDMKLAPDGSGGAVFVWEDDRNNADYIYAQRFNASGQAQWTSNGVPVSSFMGRDPRIAPASDGKYLVLWADIDSTGEEGQELRIQKLDSDGLPQWSTNGVVVTDPTGSAPNEYELASDGAGGAIVVWKDNHAGSEDIYAQRVFSSGSIYPISAPGSVAASDGTYSDRVRVTWGSVSNASSYEVWRNNSNDTDSATRLADGRTSTTYDDTGATAEKTYYYWVKAVCSSGYSDFGGPDTGYSSSTGTTASLSPVYRLYSYGSTDSTYEHLWTTSEAEKDTLDSWPSWEYEGIAWYGYTNAVTGSTALYRLYASSVKQHHYTIDTTEYGLLDGNGTWTGEGIQYYVLPASSSGSSAAYRFYHAGLALHHFTISDNERDTITNNPSWGYVYEGIGFYVFATNEVGSVSGTRGSKATGDKSRLGEQYSRRCEPAERESFVSNTGDTQGQRGITSISHLTSDILHRIAVPGDYNGDGIEDTAWYEESTGNWNIPCVVGESSSSSLQSDTYTLIQWGGPGLSPVAGDYDGDGVSDLALYDRTSGAWYVVSVAAVQEEDCIPILYGEEWGGEGLDPVAMDYDGDGISDLAVMDVESEQVFVRSVGGQLLRWGDHTVSQ